MPTSRQGSVHLFRFRGIDVFLHWSWFLFAVFEINMRAGRYSSIIWNVVEYLALFLIVLMHEFGHALACRQVGGQANNIVLWPLGGVAYVDPPPRPGAVLWSLAAGPLVNVVLIPVILVLVKAAHFAPGMTNSNLFALLRAIFIINAALLIFNMLPIYPLDGGQILRALLWFLMGRARSLMTATVIGFIGVAGLIVVAVRIGSVWFGVLSVFILLNCWGGMKQAVMLLRASKMPRHHGFSCPWCKASPPVGNFWRCAHCRVPFDTFATNATCPNCGTHFDVTRCLDCGRMHPMSEWAGQIVATPTLSDVQPSLHP
jgi:Zn-dependent protease